MQSRDSDSYTSVNNLKEILKELESIVDCHQALPQRPVDVRWQSGLLHAQLFKSTGV